MRVLVSVEGEAMTLLEEIEKQQPCEGGDCPGLPIRPRQFGGPFYCSRCWLLGAARAESVLTGKEGR